MLKSVKAKMEFEWDTVKAQSNVDKYGVSFVETLSVFGDPLEFTIPDSDHSEGEARFLSLGLASGAACWWCRILSERASSPHQCQRG